MPSLVRLTCFNFIFPRCLAIVSVQSLNVVSVYGTPVNGVNTFVYPSKNSAPVRLALSVFPNPNILLKIFL